LRIEIIDPVAEPLERGQGDFARAADQSSELDEWMASLIDAWEAGLRHVAPVRRVSRRGLARMQRIGRSVSDRATQLRNDGNPRRGSLVRQHVFEPFDAVATRLPADAEFIPLRGGSSLRLTSGFRPLPSGGRQADASLSLRGSWPRLPLVVRVEPWWREQSIVSVELRTRRRLRYPRRYFRSAHSAAREIGATVSGHHLLGG